MTRTKRLRKLREQLKQLHAAGKSADDVFKRLQREVTLTPDELEGLSVYCEDLYGIGPDTYKQMLGEERYAKVMAGYDQEWRERHGGEAKGGRTDMSMSAEAMEMLDKCVKEADEDEKLTPWQRKMKEFHRQTWKGGGAFQTEIIRPEHKLALLLAGEERYLRIISEWLEVLRTGQQHPLCLACDHEFTAPEQPFAFSFAIPFIDDCDTTAIVTGICEKCSAKSDAELLEIAYQGFRELGFPLCRGASTIPRNHAGASAISASLTQLRRGAGGTTTSLPVLNHSTLPSQNLRERPPAMWRK